MSIEQAMADSPVSPAIVGIVRQYSLKAAEELPDNAPAQALGQVEIDQQSKESKHQEEVVSWKKWLHFEDPPRSRYSQYRTQLVQAR